MWAAAVEYRRGPSEGRTKSSMNSNMVFSLYHSDTLSLSARTTTESSLQRRVQGAETPVITASFTLLLLFPRERYSPAQRRHFQFQQHVGQNKDSRVPPVHSQLYFYRTACSRKRPGRHLGRRNLRTSTALVSQVLRRRGHKTRV